MERLSLKRPTEIRWNQRAKLHPHLHPTSYNDLHPDIKLKQAIRQRKAEEVIHDIISGSTAGDLQRLGIKHLTRER